jgi:Helix-turn-helix
MPSFHDAADEHLEVLPLVVIAQTFPARPSSIPEIRDFVNRCLAQSPLSDEDSRAITQTVSQALLEAAGPTGTIQVSFRIFPEHAEVDVLRSHPGTGPAGGALAGLVPQELRPSDGGQRPPGTAAPGGAGAGAAAPGGAGAGAAAPGGAGGPAGSGAPERLRPAGEPPTLDDPSGDAGDTSFAGWMASALRREGMTMEAAARQLGVSVKTVSRWVGGATEPRLRDLRRIRELFGDFPFP